MARHIKDPGAILADTITAASALGFVPVAVHFNLFSLLVEIGPRATCEAITDASNEKRSASEKQRSPLCVQLTGDTLLAMASLGFVDFVEDEVFEANQITYHIDKVPSAIHGMLFFTTESLLCATFLMRKLVDTNFHYPFDERDTPTQYAYKLLGQDELAKEHFYGIMYLQGRMPSFNKFMEGKFGKFGTMPARIQSFGYDLAAVLSNKQSEVVVVDVGGGQGEMLLEVKAAFPHLEPKNLVLQEYNPDIHRSDELTIMDWDYKSETPQPVKGALVYSFTHIYHNLPDLDALQLMRKTVEAMEPHSRLWIHEFSKNAYYGKMHAGMIQMLGGRERSKREWHQMASLCGLKITFEVYPDLGEGLIEMVKLD